VQAERPLAFLLLRGGRWFDRGLLDRLAADGWTLTAAQSLVFAHLDARGTRPAELARRLGTSRQAAHELVGGLVRLGALAVVEEPGGGRGRLVVLTAEGRRLARAAGTHLQALERELGERLGPDAVEVLRAVLDRPWGEPSRPDGPAPPERDRRPE
jgi:DNA-binding MarR family transcriptional regulator